jgi:hypothetical protein
MGAVNRRVWLNPRVAVALSLVFFAGALVGALTMRWSIHRADSRPAAFYTIDGKEVPLEQLARELQLNPAQAQEMEMMLDDFVMYVQMLQTQMDEVRASGKSRIFDILDEQQRMKFEKMMTEVQARSQ